ncbi:DNA mismatch repair endonuclease MutL [Colidextribacter sp. OB.20]|uniref:DNA mismatch repair endonuclease MutL n=1 Tax=Colidextribacter sp. OB.20 TaxID=2304568 RepID=UPI0013716EDF|nr:DNA mismatch repair endonuclease MutL [Colidextribacter sp. OB.20]NBI10839.1 DNA mismatch repair endonuclease MutL [Colidextribacter sp. OB.20]
MSTIQVLDPHVADLIAAGEVVERPASVVKELMENAIDAGASAVTVEISHGGLTFLRVTDDGTGIPASELKTAFLRHATSKLRTEYDLEAIGTLGFRGEALAAIAAVSRVEVLSRRADAQLGASLRLEGGVSGELEEAGCPLGTTMVVRDLFFNTPARLKFMKKDAAEGAAVFAVVQRTALSHPEVSVKFIRDGRQELLTPGDGQLKSAVYAVLGRELALGFREVKAAGEDMSVEGFVSMPACCRASRGWQFFFVNGRQVKSPLMTAALEEAYKNQRMVGKFPGCVLHLKTKLNAVDVNVHPAKTEVKFGTERAVFSAVYHAVLSALERDSSHPQAVLKNTELPGVWRQDTVTENQLRIGGAPASPFMGEVARRAGGGPLSQPAADNTPRGEARRPLPTVVRVHDSAYTPPVPTQRQKPPFEGRHPSTQTGAEDYTPQGGTEKVKQIYQPPAAPHSSTPPNAIPSQPSADSTPQKEPLPPETVTEGVPELPWRVAGEVLNTYIIVERGETVYFIDKHAAHERMNFDRMKAAGYDPMAQTLLTPVVCRLSPAQREVLLEHRPLLEEFGFEADELGSDLAVRQAPFDVDAADIPAALEELAQKLLTAGSADPAAARDELLHTMACKAAIKGGWHSSPQELERVAGAVMSGQVKYCPHGRPVAIELTRRELEKQFKRA